LGVSAFWRGDLAGANKHLQDAIEGYDDSHRDAHLSLYAQDPKAICLIRRALAEHWSGDASQAGQTARSALELAVSLDHLMTTAYVMTYASVLAAEAEDYPRLRERLEDADRLWQRVPIGYLGYVLDALRGFLEVREGATGQGIERIVECVTRSRVEGENLHLTYTLLVLARARLLAGQWHEGRAALRDAISWTDRCNQRYLEAELWRLDGELAYHSGETNAAADSLRKAVAVARDQGAKWMALRALHALNRRFPDEASRENLADLVQNMPSGRDLPAFRSARDFLEGAD
jgi:tetratricopeptide (TPR) repeat protein